MCPKKNTSKAVKHSLTGRNPLSSQEFFLFNHVQDKNLPRWDVDAGSLTAQDLGNILGRCTRTLRTTGELPGVGGGFSRTGEAAGKALGFSGRGGTRRRETAAGTAGLCGEALSSPQESAQSTHDDLATTLWSSVTYQDLLFLLCLGLWKWSAVIAALNLWVFSHSPLEGGGEITRTCRGGGSV